MSELPKHVAIIMDGNGRWAKKNKLSVALGHQNGVEALREIVRHASDVGINVLSLYAFSTENWKRSPAEVEALMKLILVFFSSEIDELKQKNVKIRIIGEKEGLPKQHAQVVSTAEEETKENTGLQLNIALNYGSKDEILRAVQRVSADVKNGILQPEQINDEVFSSYLDTHDQPPVDLLIRTSGEMRISNFLLYQCAYAEMMFPEVLWPDFSKQMFADALTSFSQRDRRFGGRKQ